MKFDDRYDFYIQELNKDWRDKIKKISLPIAGAAALGYGLHKLDDLNRKHFQTKLQPTNAQPNTNKSEDDAIFLQPATEPKVKQTNPQNQKLDIPKKIEPTDINPIDDNLVNFVLYHEYQPMIKVPDDKEFVLFKNKLDGNIELPGGVTRNGIEDAKRYGTLPKDFTLPEKMTKADIKMFLKTKILPAYEKAIDEIVKVPLSVNQKKALISFTYNTGTRGLKMLVNGTKEDPRLNQGNYKSPTKELPKWNKVVTKKKIKDPKTGEIQEIKIVKTASGLTKRRASELKLFNS